MRVLNYLCMLAPPFMLQAHAFMRPVVIDHRPATAAIGRAALYLARPRTLTTSSKMPSRGGKIVPTSTTVNDAYKELRLTFEEKGIPEPDESARYLVCAAANLRMTYTAFTMALERPMNTYQLQKLKVLKQQRLKRVPVQYIVGHWDFCALRLKVEPPVLIPRPETEELVELVAQTHMPEPTPLRILDVGCGTGAIGLALLKKNELASVVGIDINPKAVALTRHNVGLHHQQSRYSAVLASISSFQDTSDEGFDIIVSNPPYIPTEELATLETELQYEDRRALDGGPDGLDVVRQIFLAAGRLLKPGKISEVWLEVSHSQPPVIAANAALGKYDTATHSVLVKEWFRDMSKHPRFVRAVVTPKHGRARQGKATEDASNTSA